ncbi:unnamed protein product [Schistosoma curassoni]|uniref:DUF659 domain-containing protein n=1 Tax=Schistosoma curassoni TaxID=6186 RepID=A0A183JDT9_9TREM|nr:unnamed protein product [Schistosoma curassoni]
MEPNTFIWDTCGPHTIMNSLGGGIIQLKYALNSIKLLLLQKQLSNNYNIIIQLIMNDLHKYQINYNIIKSSEEIQTVNSVNLSKCCNRNGLLAYRNPLIASQILLHIVLNQK